MSPGIEDFIRREALAHGFAAAGIARIDGGLTFADTLRPWLDAGHHAGMDWMADRAALRARPGALWPEARSAIVLAMAYSPERDPLDDLAASSRGNISVYARGRDYHDVIKGKLKLIAGRLMARGEAEGYQVKVFVDTAPLMEKPLAEAAGIGWQGKHTVLLSREHGNWLFLGVILTTMPLVADARGEAHCGTCTRCLDICPTGAFPQAGVLDSRRCISYLTIEHKGPIAVEFRAAMGNRIFGCDDCLAACPWNKFAAEARESKLKAMPEHDLPPLADLLVLDDAAFRARFAGAPVKRTGRDRFLRNVLIAAGNAADPALVKPVRARLADPSPLVRGMAVWALSRLAPALLAVESARMADETEADVLDEWRLALQKAA
jgi:epoxyqueuosine reductase